MVGKNYLRGSGRSALVVLLLIPGAAQAQSTEETDPNTGVGEIVVTAQKRSESINRVGMSISAVTGDQLVSKGVTDVSQLAKVVPGFVFNNTLYGAAVYTIRGVGFQESSLAASPTVSVYVDEVPIPFSAETLGATLDLERVEVLKGPQGTLYGQNSTGGAINYIAAKPDDSLELGANGSFGRFNTTDLSGFVSGPLASNLKSRLSVRYLRGDAWQRSISRPNDRLGRVNQLFGRLLTEWEPTDNLKITVNLNGWRDRSESPGVQLAGFNPAFGFAALPPQVAALPPVPTGDARAADWDPNSSFKRDNWFYQGALRADWSLTGDITLTSITSYQKYNRDMAVDTDGTQFMIFDVRQNGRIETFFQELRLAGSLGEGHWMIGANYQSDKTRDRIVPVFTESSGAFLGGSFINENEQDMETKAIYANVDYPLIDGLSAQGAIRYTGADRDMAGCSRDTGDGQVAAALNAMTGGVFGYVPGGCITLLNSGVPGVANKTLDQENISWRAGLNFQIDPRTLLYANVGRGYKAGSFPNLVAVVESQLTPVTQESLLAYEAGFKVGLGNFAQVNGAFFYYDYANKQIRGLTTTIFGNAETLLNVPKSHVIGFELSGTLRPIDGLTISPSITLVKSQIDGNFTNFDGLGLPNRLTGESFPNTPKWQGNTDVDYRFSLNDHLGGFVGANVSYQTRTNGVLGANPQFNIPGYALLDLRAGVEDPSGLWSVSVWGRNVTDKYHLQTSVFSYDTIVRFAGMPATYGLSFSVRYR